MRVGRNCDATAAKYRSFVIGADFEHRKAHEEHKPNGIFRRVVVAENMTVCFLFTGDAVSRENRRSHLENVCFIARGKVQEHSVVLGIATEMAIREESSLDYCLLEIPEWGTEQEREMKRLQDATGTVIYHPQSGWHWVGPQRGP